MSFLQYCESQSRLSEADCSDCSSRNVANSLSRDVFGSPVVQSSLHVERSNPILEASTSSFSQVPISTPKERNPFCFRIKLQLLKRQQTPP